jgi:glycosyltransferase involved in cell wall biosynthesis
MTLHSDPYVVACLMVHNEAAIIKRCLDSLAGHVDMILVQDHGSTDGTREIVSDYPANTFCVNALWRDFGANRNLLLNNALTWQVYPCNREKNLWFLLVDADHTVNFVDGWRHWLTLDIPGVYTLKHAGPLGYWVPRLIRSDVPAEYVGTTHEYLNHAPVPARQFTGITITDHDDGSSHVIKLQRDIVLLRRQIERTPKIARWHFYLGQTLETRQKYGEAADEYFCASELSRWDEEQYVSMYRAGRCELHYNQAQAAEMLLVAHAMRPTRLEALVTYGNKVPDPALRRRLLEPYRRAPIPDDTLFVETDKWALRDRILKEGSQS